jgi:hypothetical protein
MEVTLWGREGDVCHREPGDTPGYGMTRCKKYLSVSTRCGRSERVISHERLQSNGKLDTHRRAQACVYNDIQRGLEVVMSGLA